MDAETSHIPGNTKTREATTTDKLGLVIGGGGSVGIAWEIGILKALESAGVSLRSIPIVIGTSAGSMVSAQYFSGRNIDVMVNEQHNPGWMVHAAKLFPTRGFRSLSSTISEPETREQRSVRLGQAGAETRSAIPQWVFLRMVKMVAKVSRWPEAVDLRLAATDCATGQTKLWSIKDNVPIISAIASSCCVPKIAPPIKINGRKYVDGGCGSANNLDKITETEARRVIFVGPFGGEHSAELGQEKLYLKQDAEQLRQAGYEVLLITPSERLAKEAGNDFLNPRLTPVAVECGIEDGLRITEEVRSFIAGRLTTI